MEFVPSAEPLFPGFFLTPSAVAAPAPRTRLICLTTVYGDTLSGLAGLFGGTAEEIARMNGIEDPDRIFPGQRLYLRVPASTPIASCDTYTVKIGDTLSGIAARLGLQVDALVALNGLFDPDLIFPGQALRLAAPTEPASPNISVGT